MGKRFLVGWHRRLRRNAISRFSIVATAVAAVFASGSTALAQQEDPTWVLSSGASFTLFPSGDLYPVYVADPHRPTNVLAESFTLGGSIPDTDSPLTRLGAGGRFGVLRFGPARPEGRAWQVSIEAGFDSLFDSGNRLDAAGWDGNYGLTVTTTSQPPVGVEDCPAARFGAHGR